MVIRMASSDTVSAVLEFYAAYRSAFDGHDAEAIVGFYRFPCHIVSDGALRPFTSWSQRH
jgi:ketosteroid isomerase-like protein